MPNERSEGAGWRRFTPRQVFAIAVCKEIRDQFGVPLESLRFVREFMLQEGADHLQVAIRLMAMGFSVCLLTDLKDTFVLDSDVEVEDLVSNGFLRASSCGFILIGLNGIVNRILRALDLPEIRISEDVYDEVHWLRDGRTEGERQVLAAIRARDFERVVVTRPNQKDLQLELHQVLSDLSASDILSLVEASDFQDVEVKRNHGRNAKVTKKTRVRIKDRP